MINVDKFVYNDEDVLEWEDKSANEILMSNFLSRKEDD